MLLSVPLGRRLIDSIPAELLDDQLAASGEPVGDLIDGRIQVLDVVQRIAGDCCIKRPSLTKLLQGGASKDRPVWSFRIDGDDFEDLLMGIGSLCMRTISRKVAAMRNISH